MLPRKKFTKYLRPIFEFLLFFSFSALVVLGVETVFYLLKHKWPAARVIFWSLSTFATLWMIGGMWLRDVQNS